MDGDAKITRRNSSDGESAEGGSVLELDRSKYLDSYQNSSPMQPGTYPYHTSPFVSHATCSTLLIHCTSPYISHAPGI